MGALILQHHPVESSLNAALLDAAVEGAELVGGPPRVIRVPAPDWPDHHTMLPPDTFEGVDHLIVIYPTWWGALPARLLQVFSDLLAPIVDGDRTASTSPLRDIEQLTVITTHGSPRWQNRFQGEPGLRWWKRTVRPLCAPTCRFTWTALYGLDTCDESARIAFVDKVRSRLTTLSAASA